MQGKKLGFSFPFFPSRKYLVLLLIVCPIIAASSLPAAAKERRAEITYSVDLNAPADGKPLNEDLFGFNLGYKITFREI